MTLTFRFRDGPVDTVTGDDAAEMMWALYLLGVHPSLSLASFNERIGHFEHLLSVPVDDDEDDEVDDDDDDPTGGVSR